MLAPVRLQMVVSELAGVGAECDGDIHASSGKHHTAGREWKEREGDEVYWQAQACRRNPLRMTMARVHKQGLVGWLLGKLRAQIHKHCSCSATACGCRRSRSTGCGGGTCGEGAVALKCNNCTGARCGRRGASRCANF